MLWSLKKNFGLNSQRVNGNNTVDSQYLNSLRELAA